MILPNGMSDKCRFAVWTDEDGEIYIVDGECHDGYGDYRVMKMVQDGDFPATGMKELAEGVALLLNMALDQGKIARIH